MRLIYAAGTHKGLVRPNNQDAFLCKPEKGIFAVADGLGGHQAGEVASKLVLEVLNHNLKNRPIYNSRADWLNNQLSNKKKPIKKNLRFWLTKIFNEAGQNIIKCAKLKANFAGLGSTLVLLAFEGRSVLIANLGDSRAYLFRNKSLYKLSTDHNLATELLAEGVLEPKDSAFQSNILTKALCDAKVSNFNPDISRHVFLPNDIFMLCTDGLYQPLGDNVLRQLLLKKDPLNIMVGNMIAKANDLGGPDNISVLLIHILDDND